MSTVFAEDKQHGAVKIVKKGSKWNVHVLSSVRCRVKHGSYGGPNEYSLCKWDWEKQPRWSYPYAPFEARDVVNNQNKLDIDFIRTWTPKFRQII